MAKKVSAYIRICLFCVSLLILLSSCAREEGTKEKITENPVFMDTSSPMQALPSPAISVTPVPTLGKAVNVVPEYLQDERQNPDNPNVPIRGVIAWIHGLDQNGQEVWKYVSGFCSEDSKGSVGCGELGIYNGKYYMMEDYHVQCLDLEDGDLLWRSEEEHGTFDGSCFGENGCLYLNEPSKGKDLVVVDLETGKTIFTIDKLMEQYDQPHGLDWVDGYVKIMFDYKDGVRRGVPYTFYIDPVDYSVHDEIE